MTKSPPTGQFNWLDMAIFNLHKHDDTNSRGCILGNYELLIIIIYIGNNKWTKKSTSFITRTFNFI